MRIAICMPTKGRAAQMKARVNSLLLRPTPGNVELVISLAVCEDDTETLTAVRDLISQWYESGVMIVVTYRPPGSTAVEGWNAAYRAVADIADWFVLGADDIVWHGGWLAAALDVAEESGAQVIGLYDGHTNLIKYAPHYMASRIFCRDVLADCIAPTAYKAWWFDREVCELAKRRGVYAPAWAAWAIHLHPDWHTAEMDATYREAWPLHDEDRLVYKARRAELMEVA